MKMKMCEFRKLRANELQVKCTDTKYKGSATLLIYKDARVDQKVLDETVTPMRWQKDYKEIDGKVYCGVAIKNPENDEWIWKWDCGTEGNFEAEKSEASDAFKRACFNWGLGRELYDTPKIKVDCPDRYYYNDKLTMSFSVKSIEWNNDTLVDLVIIDRNGMIVYDYKNGVPTINKAQTKPVQQTQKSNYDILVEFCKQAKASGENQEELKKFYNFYKDKANTWKNTFNVSVLWNKWIERSKKPHITPTKEDYTIQDYEEMTYGADDPSFYY